MMQVGYLRRGVRWSRRRTGGRGPNRQGAAIDNWIESETDDQRLLDDRWRDFELDGVVNVDEIVREAGPDHPLSRRGVTVTELFKRESILVSSFQTVVSNSLSRLVSGVLVKLVDGAIESLEDSVRGMIKNKPN